MMMSKDELSIDSILDNYYAPIKLPDNNRDRLKQALFQLLLEEAKEYSKDVPADDEWHRVKKVKAIPVSKLKELFNKEDV